MIITKKGRLCGIKYIVEKNGEVKSAMIVKFNKNKYFVFLPNKNKGEIIKEFVDKFDLGITNAKTFFNYIDFKNLIQIKFNLYCGEDEIYYKDILKGFEPDIAKDILDIISNMNYNCDIINIGLTFHEETTNSLKIDGEIPDEILSKYHVKPIMDESVENNCCDFNNKSIKDLLERESIQIKDNMVISIFNNWSNEDWNGPQSYGGIESINCDLYTNNGFADYDFQIKNIDSSYLFDENTIIHLLGNQSNDFEFLLPLKKIHFLSGLKDSKIFSKICEDIDSLSTIKYKTHKEELEEDNTLYIMPIKIISKYLEDYEKYVLNRKVEIQKYIKKIKPKESNSTFNDLPF